MVGGPAPGRADTAAPSRGPAVDDRRPMADDVAERCRTILSGWDADPHPTQFVQVDAPVLRGLLERLAAAETIELDVREGHPAPA